MTDYIAEFGGNARFLDASQVKTYDGEGNEIEIPKCEKCGSFKIQVIGKESFVWLCPLCARRSNDLG